MKFESEHIDIGIFEDAFTLSSLYNLHSQLKGVQTEMERILETAMHLKDTPTAVKLTKELMYLADNIDTIEVVMLGKELEIFMPDTPVDMICLN